MVYTYMLAIVFLAVWGTMAYGAAKTGLNGKSLFKRKCGLCHSIKRPMSKRKTKEEWKKTVMRMKDTNGCPITDEQAEAIIQYLSQHYRK
jgi:mono/diheme cytochrome c family protein